MKKPILYFALIALLFGAMACGSGNHETPKANTDEMLDKLLDDETMQSDEAPAETSDQPETGDHQHDHDHDHSGHDHSGHNH